MTPWLALGLLSPAPAAVTCTEWAEPALLAECDSIDINESSGLAPSALRPGHWFTHNDAGGSAELFVFDEAGAHVETYEVAGAGFRDWEALGAGPCPEAVAADHCLYIGDIGDNGRSRADVFVYVVPEPAPGGIAEVAATWRLGWPEGAEDSEALAVHPCTGRVYLISKHNDGRDPTVWRLPPVPAVEVDPTPLEYVATLPQLWLNSSGKVTGAEWSPGGEQLVLRTYGGAWIWQTDLDDPDAHWSTAPTPLPLDTEGQGEAIAFSADGDVVASTERVPMRLTETACLTAVEAPACPPPEPGDSGGPDSGGSDSGDTASTGPGDSAAIDDSAGDGGPAGTSPGGGEATPRCGCGGAATAAWLPLLLLAGARRRDR